LASILKISVVPRFIFILAVLAPISALSQCLVEADTYSNFGASETSIRLELLVNNDFNLIYKEWAPGDAGSSDEIQLQGQWLCLRRQIVLESDRKIHYLNLLVIGDNPLGLDEAMETLQFEKGDLEFLLNEVLYPLPEE